MARARSRCGECRRKEDLFPGRLSGDLFGRRPGPMSSEIFLLPKRALLAWCVGIFWVFSFDTLRGQNIVESAATRAPQFTANPVRLTDTDVSEFLFRTPAFGAATPSREAQRIAAKLEAHVRQFLEGAPWM